MTPAVMIEKYIKLRNKLDQIKGEHKKQLEPFLAIQSQLENVLLDYLNQNNLQSVNGEAGTAYKSVMTSVTVKDWPRTLEYIQTNQLWDLLEARVSKTAALEVIDETKKPVPGVQVAQAVVVRVRAG